MTTAQRWGWLLRAEPGVVVSMQEYLDAAVSLVPEVVSVAVASSVTTLDGDTYSTPAASAGFAIDLDVAQYANGEGPCMTAARDGRLQLVQDTATADRFAGFGAVAARLGVRSSLSVPFRTPSHPAALNIYAAEPHAFDHHDQVVAEFVGRALTQRLVGSAGVGAVPDADADRVAARRTLIRAAMDLVAEPGATPEEQFAALAARSVHDDCSIFDVAAGLTGATKGAA